MYDSAKTFLGPRVSEALENPPDPVPFHIGPDVRSDSRRGSRQPHTARKRFILLKVTLTVSAAMSTTSGCPSGAAVRDYLTQEGMAASSVTAKGLGKTQPVASNDTAKGRQQNRRVELVISGDVIGTETPIAAR
jgi:hypothetical protein